ncbi:MAG: MipA/OmpV family protein, partial [Deltaproteobacteria bacterium]|nr:MipA/OmpV family protein [Deltaproteobacteria bacterium]
MKLSYLIGLCLFALIWTVSPVTAAQHTAGLGVGYAPDYEGSDDYQGIPMLMLRGHYDSGRYFALVGTNLKVNLLASKTYSLGPVF